MFDFLMFAVHVFFSGFAQFFGNTVRGTTQAWQGGLGLIIIFIAGIYFLGWLSIITFISGLIFGSKMYNRSQGL